MGEVYRANDLQLKRPVALKVLPAESARDPVRLSRFRREAELLASLSHPNIAAVFGIAETEDTKSIVLEIIEGNNLAERIAAGPIPIKQALDIARQIADALEAAHQKAIIHRDLKPANVKVTSAGRVKVLDFGLAKVFTREPAGLDLSQTPTLPSGTMENAIMGTPAYMSPEPPKGTTLPGAGPAQLPSNPTYAISPDGRFLVLTAIGKNGVSSLWLRSLDDRRNASGGRGLHSDRQKEEIPDRSIKNLPGKLDRLA